VAAPGPDTDRAMTHQHKRTKQRTCEGKRRHESRAAALGHLASLRRQGAFVALMEPYRCPFCTPAGGSGVWHVGHRKRGRR
jgi:hypothetical protein